MCVARKDFVTRYKCLCELELSTVDRGRGEVEATRVFNNESI